MSDAFGKATLYHESGAVVELDVLAAVNRDDSLILAKRCYDYVTDLLQVGFKAHPPGLEEGEQKFVVGYVVHREFEDSRDGQITPVLDIYSTVEGQNKFKALKVYLNTEDDVAAFESVSGMRLESMQKYIGTGDIERGKSRQLDQLVYKVPRPFSAIWTPNPKYDEAAAKAAKPGEYMVPKRKWVRWEGSAAKTESKPEKEKDAIAKEVDWWKKFIANDPPLQNVNDHIRRLLIPMATKEAKQMVFAQVISPWAATLGAEWDAATQGYVLPKPPEDEYSQNAGAPF